LLGRCRIVPKKDRAGTREGKKREESQPREGGLSCQERNSQKGGDSPIRICTLRLSIEEEGVTEGNPVAGGGD